MNDGQQMRFTEGELDIIRGTFRDENVLKLLRKVFLPWIDPLAPIGQVIDLWMTVNVRDLPPELAQVKIMARNDLIAHVEQQLLQLKVLANQEKLSPTQVKEKSAKDSSK